MADEKENAMSETLAENEFLRWAENADISVDTSDMNDEEKATFESLKRRIVKSIVKGQTIVNDDDNLEVTLSAKNPAGYAGEKLTFEPPTAQAYIGIDNFKAHQTIHKMIAVMSAMTGKDIGFFSKIANNDFKIFMAIATFFL